MKTTVLLGCDTVNLADKYQRFGGTFRLYLQGTLLHI